MQASFYIKILLTDRFVLSYKTKEKELFEMRSGKRTVKIIPRVPQMDKIRKKALMLSPGIWVAGTIIFVIVIIWFLFASGRKETPQTPTSAQINVSENVGSDQPAPTTTSSEAKEQVKILTFLKSVRLQPPRPTRLDTLKAEIVAAPTAPKHLSFSYRWKVNDLHIKEETGDTLILMPFKKGDLITVTVTPNDGVTDGYSIESPLVAVHSSPPSLELQAMRQVRKTGVPIFLQLKSNAPDSERVVFSLEPPLVPGMTIDENSGKITWFLQQGQKGSFRFGAAVTDENGAKATTSFDITVD